jgi:hypothetical protein
MPARAHRILIPLAALLVILPILLTGPSCGHDFDFHLLSWLEAATQFAHLHYPHWAYTPAYNAGEPRFLFYPPISWSLGALLGLILPWKLVPAAFTFIALTLSGFTAHALARRYATPTAATFAALIYLANPYMLFTAYERTAYGELLAAAWLPLLFSAALAPRIRIPALALPIALLWLTNAPAGVMGCYALAIITLIRLILFSLPDDNSRHPERCEGPLYFVLRHPRLQIALPTLVATLLGLTLAAFYLVPAIANRPYIQSDMATIEGMRIVDNTLFHHMAPATEDNLAHDAVLHTASIIALSLLAAIAVTLLGLRRTLPSSLFPLPFLCLLIAFLLTPSSLPIWAHTPQLRFLQFPWRLTAILVAILIPLAAKVLSRIKWTLPFSLFPLPLLLILPAWHLFHQPCDSEDTVEARVGLYHSPFGSEPTDEYTPTTADNDSLAKTNPPYWLAPIDSPNQPAPKAFAPGQAPTHLTLTLPTPQILILNRRAFPGWHLTLNGNPAPDPRGTRDDGLITLPLPTGTSNITLTYRSTPDQPVGLALSLLAIIITAFLARRSSPPGSPVDPESGTLLMNQTST